MPRRQTPRREAAPPDSADQPLVVNGWSLFMWREMAERWTRLRAEVERLRDADQEGYRRKPSTKMLAMLAALMLHEIPADPGHARYRQGRTLGGSFAHWRRAKFFQRYRLFFRYHSERRIIVYVWLNDEGTLRQRGARTDAYAVFKRMLESGSPPDSFEDLVRASRRVRRGESNS
jgi:toxin YhaV